MMKLRFYFEGNVTVFECLAYIKAEITCEYDLRKFTVLVISLDYLIPIKG